MFDFIDFIVLAVFLIVGFIGGALVVNNNNKKAKEFIDEAKAKIDEKIDEFKKRN